MNIFKNVENNDSFEKRVDKIKNGDNRRSHSLSEINRIQRIHKKYGNELVFPKNCIDSIWKFKI